MVGWLPADYRGVRVAELYWDPFDVEIDTDPYDDLAADCATRPPSTATTGTTSTR